MAPRVNDMARELADRMALYRDKSFIEGALAACALVAAADRQISYSEKIRLHRLFEGVGALGVFSSGRAVALFDAFADDLIAEEPGARDRALDRVRAVSGDHGAAQALVQICVLISHADDVVHPAEVAEISEICGALGIDPVSPE